MDPIANTIMRFSLQSDRWPHLTYMS